MCSVLLCSCVLLRSLVHFKCKVCVLYVGAFFVNLGPVSPLS
jgi:hypothetical protein